MLSSVPLRVWDLSGYSFLQDLCPPRTGTLTVLLNPVAQPNMCWHHSSSLLCLSTLVFCFCFVLSFPLRIHKHTEAHMVTNDSITFILVVFLEGKEGNVFCQSSLFNCNSLIFNSVACIFSCKWMSYIIILMAA